MATSRGSGETLDSIELVQRDAQDGNERTGSYDDVDNGRISQNTVVDDDNATDGNEDESLLEKDEDQQASQPAQPRANMCSAIIWMVVFTNKTIFSFQPLKLAQLTFAAFHFYVTWLTLYILSRPSYAFFPPHRTAIKEIIPISIAMSLNVILPNLSLAYSSVTFYQVARILLTPIVALMNYVLYNETLPRNAILALIPACVGVGIVSYYDSLPAGDERIQPTSGLGVIFAFTGIVASSLYTVWISSYRRKLQMTSMQLLYNQAPASAFLLLYVIPFVDVFPNWNEVPVSKWVLILASGLFASLINISQFFVIAQTGPVSSTVHYLRRNAAVLPAPAVVSLLLITSSTAAITGAIITTIAVALCMLPRHKPKINRDLAQI
ncbi:hypothetical protein DL762_009613 [Monosporascus cannonballus]|uniref:GDP-mannose transporter n=1 Tax=Monosporascus cannonballus TaxID=155416 RepID=A0ABY0GW16_9PEZI|nr:hypothetical protein DL762_009613 [Monosporascus cannonballus]